MNGFPLKRIVCGIALALGAHSAHAQTSAKIGIQGGLTAPMDNFGRNLDVGYNFGLLLDLRAPASPVSFRIDGMYHSMDVSGNSSTNVNVLAGTANVVIRLDRSLITTPYIIGGAGLYRTRVSFPNGSDANSDMGFNVGGGLQFGMSGLTAFVEARYHAVHDENVRFLPVTFGILF
jgi:opacity protein-like surface antigen